MAEETWKDLDKLDRKVDKVRMKHSEILSVPQDEGRLKTDLDELTFGIKRMMNATRLRLRAMEMSVAASDDGRMGAEFRVRRTQHQAGMSLIHKML